MATPPARKRRKARSVRKEEIVVVRMTVAQKRAMVAAADGAGLGLSSWIRSVALAATRSGAAAEMETPLASDTETRGTRAGD